MRATGLRAWLFRAGWILCGATSSPLPARSPWNAAFSRRQRKHGPSSISCAVLTASRRSSAERTARRGEATAGNPLKVHPGPQPTAVHPGFGRN